jgi:SAM-dependent methyltransferase
MGDLRGKTILDLGCGTGDLTVILAKRGGWVTGVDVSLASIEIATRRARINRVSDEMTATVMSAYSLAFADGTFDVVAGKAVLHHLDLVRSRDEILRVLKPGGRGCFIEPILFSRFLGLVRNIVPVPVDRDSPDERQLSISDVELFGQKFGTTTLKEIGLISSRLERFFPQIPWWLRLLFSFDSRALHYFPLLRKYASTMLMVVTK